MSCFPGLKMSWNSWDVLERSCPPSSSLFFKGGKLRGEGGRPLLYLVSFSVGVTGCLPSSLCIKFFPPCSISVYLQGMSKMTKGRIQNAILSEYLCFYSFILFHEFYGFYYKIYPIIFYISDIGLQSMKSFWQRYQKSAQIQENAQWPFS